MSKTIQIHYGNSAENDAEAAQKRMAAARARGMWSGAAAPRLQDRAIMAAEAAALDALAKVREAYEERIADLERELDARAKLAASGRHWDSCVPLQVYHTIDEVPRVEGHTSIPIFLHPPSTRHTLWSADFSTVAGLVCGGAAGDSPAVAYQMAVATAIKSWGAQARGAIFFPVWGTL